MGSLKGGPESSDRRAPLSGELEREGSPDLFPERREEEDLELHPAGWYQRLESISKGEA